MIDNKVPVVSVCMITYNQEAYIAQAIEGVLMQITCFPFELIIGEDCSTDNTRSIVKEYENKYPGVIFAQYPETNRGMMNNFITVLQSGRGKYVALCEGDDYWTDPFKLQKQVDFLEKHPDYSLCFHNAILNNLITNTQTEFNRKLNKNTFTIKDIILQPWFTPTASFVFRNNNIDISKWNGANGDMSILFTNAINGKIFYFDEIMSIYNYGTLSSLSVERKNKPIKLLRKNLILLNHIDIHTHFRYIFYTLYKRLNLTAFWLWQLIKLKYDKKYF